MSTLEGQALLEHLTEGPQRVLGNKEIRLFISREQEMCLGSIYMKGSITSRCTRKEPGLLPPNVEIELMYMM